MAYVHRGVALGLLLWLTIPASSFAASSGGAAAGAVPELEILSSMPDPVLRRLVENALRQFKKGKTGTTGLDADSPELADDDAEPVPRIRRLKPGDTVLLRFDTEPPAQTRRDTRPPAGLTVPPPVPIPAPATDESTLSPEERLRREEQRRLRKALLPSKQVFVLDSSGALVLEHIGRMVLAGLSEEEAAARIGAEPVFEGLFVSLRLLPIEPELKPFGHDIFSGAPKTLMPATDIPVPPDYVVGPGDIVIVQMYGKDSAEHELMITREGMLPFPGIGPIPVAGKKFSQMQKELQERARRQLIGTRVSVSLGRLRAIRVFVLGEVERPGSYTVSGLATLTNALLASGGIKRHGSLRHVQLKRGGETVANMDVYELLLHGDSQADARVMPGDVIFVPPAGRTVGVGGRVRRPAIYELKNENTVADVLQLAGGLLADADTGAVQIERVTPARTRAVEGGDLGDPAVRGLPVRDGDIVRVYPIQQRLNEVVTVEGHVARPGPRAWRSGMRLTDALPSLAALQPEADARYLLIARPNRAEGTTELQGADLLAALEAPTSDANVELAAGDTVRIFDRREDRATLLKPILERARVSTAPGRPMREVTVEGAVHHPGRYPWAPTMRVTDLLKAAGGLTDQAYTLEAELTRRFTVDGRAREQARQTVDLSAALRGGDKDVALEAYDQLVIRRIPKWAEEGTVEIVGEVQFPGKYPIARGERLSRVLQRAGGLTSYAYPKGAIFLRDSVRQREQEYLERLTAQLERDLGVFATSGPELGVKKEVAIAEGQALLQQMRAAKATGRMVINVSALLDVREGYDIVVQPGDKLIIPQRPDEVTVLGEVYYPTSHLHVAGHSRDEYIRLSGGVTERGNKKAVYVVHADGSVSPPRRWFANSIDVGPGDTVIVPLKVDRISNLKLFTDISTILFQLAVTTAALDAIGVL